MAGMIKSIFGLTTEDVREQQLKQQQAAAQQFAQQTGANQGVASFGTALGAGLGRGLMSRLGFEDPAMAKAQEVEARQTALNEQLAALDPNDPRRQYLLAEALSSVGDTQGSLAAYASGRQMEQYQSQLAEQDRMFNFRTEQAAADKKAQAAKLFANLSATGGYGPELIANVINSAYPDSGFNIPTETTDDNEIEDGTIKVVLGKTLVFKDGAWVPQTEESKGKTKAKPEEPKTTTGMQDITASQPFDFFNSENLGSTTGYQGLNKLLNQSGK
jgi:hypothetical protein